MVTLIILTAKLIPDKFFSERQFAFVLGLLEAIPGVVDVAQHLAFHREVGLLVVGAHAALQCEQQHLQIALLHEPVIREKENVGL